MSARSIYVRMPPQRPVWKKHFSFIRFVVRNNKLEKRKQISYTNKFGTKFILFYIWINRRILSVKGLLEFTGMSSFVKKNKKNSISRSFKGRKAFFKTLQMLRSLNFAVNFFETLKINVFNVKTSLKEFLVKGFVTKNRYHFQTSTKASKWVWFNLA